MPKTESTPLSWVAASCTLPTPAQPLREREFDEMFAVGALGVEMVTPTSVRIQLRPDPGVAARAAELAVKETSCCSFFSFALIVSDGQVVLDVSVPAAQESTLRALSDRARSIVGLMGS